MSKIPKLKFRNKLVFASVSAWYTVIRGLELKKKKKKSEIHISKQQHSLLVPHWLHCSGVSSRPTVGPCGRSHRSSGSGRDWGPHCQKHLRGIKSAQYRALITFPHIVQNSRTTFLSQRWTNLHFLCVFGASLVIMSPATRCSAVQAQVSLSVKWGTMRK